MTPSPDHHAPLADPCVPQALSDTLNRLVARGEVKRYRKDTILIEEGDRGDTLYIIISGRLRAYSAATNGREITYGVYGPGEYLGEMSLDGGVRSASVQTLEASVCAIVKRETLQDFIQAHPEFAFELLTKVIRRARLATLSAKSIALNDVYGRLKLLFDTLGLPQADGTRVIGERLTHQALSHRLGCSREMVSRILRDLENGGYLRQARGGIVLQTKLPSRW